MRDEPRWPDDAPVLCADDLENETLQDWLVKAFKSKATRNEFYWLLVKELGKRSRMTFGWSLHYYIAQEKPTPLEQAVFWNKALEAAGYEL